MWYIVVRFNKFLGVGSSLPSLHLRTNIWSRFSLPPITLKQRVAYLSTSSKRVDDEHYTSTVGEIGKSKENSFSESFSSYQVEEWNEKSTKQWLKQSSWMSRHPVDKLSLLRNIGKSAPDFLLYEEGPKYEKNKNVEGMKKEDLLMEEVEHVLSMRPEKSIFLSSSGEELLSYACRLQICLSLEMWVRGLSDVQDNIARLQLPYSHSRRMITCSSPFSYHCSTSEKGRITASNRMEPSLIMKPFPTRKAEYLLDPYTTIELRVNGKLNPTGEQIPPPHTWDPELSISVLDEDATSIVESSDIESAVSEHGRCGPREGARERLQRVQGLTPRASSLDTEDKVQEKDRSSINGSQPGPCLSSGCQAAAARRNREATQAFARRLRRGFTASPFQSAKSDLPAVVFQKENDTCYHGNNKREEGCPLNNEGCATPTPIYVPVEMPFVDENNFSASTAGGLVASCIKAHAAILSSLFVEGRTVNFTTNHSALLQYVEQVFHEFIKIRALCTSCWSGAVQKDGDDPGVSTGGLLLYYPSWSTRELLVLLPPQQSFSTKEPPSFSRGDVDGLVGSIFQSLFLASSPVTIAAPGSGEQKEKNNDGEASWPSYVQAVKQRVEEQLELFFPGEVKEGKHGRIQWISLPFPFEEKYADRTTKTEDQDRCGATSNFLDHLMLLSEHFYAVQLLFVPSNSLFSAREVTELAWNRLSPDTRLVGINTSLWHSLSFFPHVPFLSHKIGNCFRYRAVDRVVVTRQLALCLPHIRIGTLASLPRLTEKLLGKRVCHIPSFHTGLPLLPLFHVTHQDENKKRASATQRHDAKAPNSTCSSYSKHNNTQRKSRSAKEHFLTSLPYSRTYFLLLERLTDYLAQSSTYTLLALCVARLFRL